MAFQAKCDYPEIEFTSSVMIGDSESDIDFGKGLGMKTIRVGVNGLIGAIEKLSQMSKIAQMNVSFVYAYFNYATLDSE